MRHGRKFKTLMGHNNTMSMLRSLTTSLIEHEAIRTTLTRAKELKRFSEKIVTLGKKGNAPLVRSVVYGEDTVNKVMMVLAPRYANRNGGYTRVLKVGARKGDQAEMAVIEFVDREGEIRPKEESPHFVKIAEKLELEKLKVEFAKKQ